MRGYLVSIIIYMIFRSICYFIVVIISFSNLHARRYMLVAIQFSLKLRIIFIYISYFIWFIIYLFELDWFLNSVICENSELLEVVYFKNIFNILLYLKTITMRNILWLTDSGACNIAPWQKNDNWFVQILLCCNLCGIIKIQSVEVLVYNFWLKIIIDS